MRLDDATWAEIKRCYRLPYERLCDLGKRFGVEPSTIRRHSISHKWGKRPRYQPPPPEAPPAPSALDAAKFRQPDTPHVRIIRLFRVIDMQLDQMEKRMTSPGEQSAEDEARQSRAFGNILSNLEKATEAAADIAKTAERGRHTRKGAGAQDEHAKAETMRREIAERLERLNAQWNAAPKSE